MPMTVSAAHSFYRNGQLASAQFTDLMELYTRQWRRWHDNYRASGLILREYTAAQPVPPSAPPSVPVCPHEPGTDEYDFWKTGFDNPTRVFIAPANYASAVRNRNTRLESEREDEDTRRYREEFDEDDDPEYDDEDEDGFDLSVVLGEENDPPMTINLRMPEPA